MKSRVLGLVLFASFAVFACSSPAAEDAATSEQAAVADTTSIINRGDGRFDVVCRDGRHEVVSADDVAANRLCQTAAVPSDLFDRGACSGTPMTEAEARAKFAADVHNGSLKVGRFSLGFRTRTPHYDYDSSRGYQLSHYTWDPAPTETFVARRDREFHGTEKYDLPAAGDVELVLENDKPFFRLTSDPASISVTDMSRQMRWASKPLRPWADARPDFELQEASADASWGLPESSWQWNLDTRGSGAYWLDGGNATKIVTPACMHYVSVENNSSLSPIRTSIAIYAVLQ